MSSMSFSHAITAASVLLVVLALNARAYLATLPGTFPGTIPGIFQRKLHGRIFPVGAFRVPESRSCRNILLRWCNAIDGTNVKEDSVASQENIPQKKRRTLSARKANFVSSASKEKADPLPLPTMSSEHTPSSPSASSEHTPSSPSASSEHTPSSPSASSEHTLSSPSASSEQQSEKQSEQQSECISPPHLNGSKEISSTEEHSLISKHDHTPAIVHQRETPPTINTYHKVNTDTSDGKVIPPPPISGTLSIDAYTPTDSLPIVGIKEQIDSKIVMRIRKKRGTTGVSILEVISDTSLGSTIGTTISNPLDVRIVSCLTHLDALLDALSDIPTTDPKRDHLDTPPDTPLDIPLIAPLGTPLSTTINTTLITPIITPLNAPINTTVAPQNATVAPRVYRTPLTSALLSGWVGMGDAGVRGRGLFALCDIEEGSYIGEYTGEQLTHRQYVTRYPKGDSEHSFLVSEDAQRRDRTYVDAADETMSNLLRFVNHDGVNPNVRVDVVYFKTGHTKQLQSTPPPSPLNKSNKSDKGDKGSKGDNGKKGDTFEIRITSVTRIAKGEELCFDYGPLYSPTKGWALNQ